MLGFESGTSPPGGGEGGGVEIEEVSRCLVWCGLDICRDEVP